MIIRCLKYESDDDFNHNHYLLSMIQYYKLIVNQKVKSRKHELVLKHNTAMIQIEESEKVTKIDETV